MPQFTTVVTKTLSIWPQGKLSILAKNVLLPAVPAQSQVGLKTLTAVFGMLKGVLMTDLEKYQ
ncbi:hypothetical protein [Leptolyngbya sp. KIOST-1]|uniref:hypothetical protein n=1 Tax=Leptolyngbya sp. KIOST-1 TaxID=1229172 RepID=UPI00056AF3D0|nr:hypothetical protein [Leptolyngbya sp. KIOST-1]